MVGPMKQRKTYRLVVDREPGWWIVEIPELDLTTQARRLGDVDKREAGKLLDLSHQRIAQLVERARRGTRV
jgi:hypothetical protein